MSGGSYNYLCASLDLTDLSQKEGYLDEMSARLAGLGYAADAARETEELLVLLRQWENRAMVRVQRMSDVWKAVEWWDSCDSGEDAVKAALEKYRAETGPAEVMQAQD